MSATTSAGSSMPSCGHGFFDILDCGSGTAIEESGQSFRPLLASIYTAAASFGGQFLLFIILRTRLSRIYRPKSYLVAERERIQVPPGGLYKWIIPMFTTSDATIIQKCGLDAYFFLRYLFMLLKIFTPLAALIIPILLPINELSGDGTARGVDVLGWQNVSPAHTHRLWAHLLLALVVVGWVLYVIYTELRGYIRIRQAYLTSPQHRLRASATTVLVSGIPKKWLTVEALDGLYDVFPGGIRNIWINRNFDELAEKVSERDDIAHSLESAETNLIRECVKRYKKDLEKQAKLEGRGKKTKEEKEQERIAANEQAENIAQGQGQSSGDPHNIPHNLHEVVEDMEEQAEEHKKPSQHRLNPMLKLGEGIGAGFGAVGHGFENVGRKLMQFPGEMTNDMNRAFHTSDHTDELANDDPGFGSGYVIDDDELYRVAPKPRPEKKQPAPSAIAISRKEHEDAESPLPDSPRSTSSGKPTGFRKPTDVNVLDRPPPLPLMPFDSNSSDQEESQVTYTVPGYKKRSKANRISAPEKAWKFLIHREPPLPFPSPQPHTTEEDEFPLHDMSRTKGADLEENPDQKLSKSKWANKFGWLAFWRKSDDEEEEKEYYPDAYNEDCAEDQVGEPVWRKYMDPKDRETIRAPLFNKSWFPRLPLVGKKLDKIYHLRKKLARLNAEIEQDQQNVEKFPFMNSAFIQFNHQVAAHMACQSLSHHIPHHMTPRMVEISPTDVLWDNMSMKWWERYLRTGISFALAIGLVIFYAVPVAFTGFLSQINYIAQIIPWLSWLTTLPQEAKAIITGVLPPAILSIILSLVPVIFRLLMKQRGVPTGSDREGSVQVYYFVFLFIQVFLVVTLSSGITDFIRQLVGNVSNITTVLARNLPKASNYFFSYLTVQALSNSASALVQVATLLKWFVWAPIADSTAREKWSRQTRLNNIKWGSFFPPFTNFAVIGIIFSIIAPLIMVFNLIVFSLYWFTQRYNVLYVYQFTIDTGGLLFPTAINQLMVGVYTLELCLIGLFFLAKDENGNLSAVPQAVIMIVMLVFTALYQWLLNDAFRPLFRYLPITLEDDAVIRDEEFARAQSQKFQRLTTEERDEDGDGDDSYDFDHQQKRKNSDEEERAAAAEERQRIRQYRRNSRSMTSSASGRDASGIMSTKPVKSRTENRWNKVKDIGQQPVKQLLHVGHIAKAPIDSVFASRENHGFQGGIRPAATGVDPQTTRVDEESQQAVGDVLFGGFSDELEDLTPEERDVLIRYSFQHSALRARRPVIWIPRDHLGVSDDEIERCKEMSTVEHIDPETEKREMKTNIWVSNEGTALDAKGRVVFRRSPPDFANVDLIAL
ncbi:hypothetical protein AAFC00_003077 [Neodothiora populina]|uniref:DUF221-domain-containing protein n=1 Tax=Neodothiora populina TaxID=2781224 RepID=A0ABR3P9X3_9PEZI